MAYFINVPLQQYSNMENHLALADIESIANVACFSIDFKEQQNAGSYFVELAKNISIDLMQHILKGGTDTLIFVTVQYANKLVDEYELNVLKSLFFVVETEVSSWYVPDAHEFRRRPLSTHTTSSPSFNPSQQITKHVMNTTAFFMSNCMKRFFLQDTRQKRQQIVQWICERTNQRYKLWLFTIFIQNISQIDQTMGFIKFRTLSYNFQEQVVPTISKCLIPFMYCVQDVMKVNEISDLQQNLNVQEETTLNSMIKKQQQIFQNQNEFKFAQLVFDLLHHLVFYNFHLTYTEYEQESTFDNCLICFPEEFTAKVVTEEFIGSMGYVIERLIDIMPQSNFLKKTLECLQKIFLTKLSYVDDKRKLTFIKECTIMMTKCLAKPNMDKFILTKLMVCNNKFLNNVEVSYLNEKAELKGAFQQWLLAITKTTVFVLENIDLREQFNFNEEESLVIECLNLYQKITCSICSISTNSLEQESNSSNQERAFISENVQTMTKILIRKLLNDQSRPLIEQSTAQIFKTNILQIKSFCSCFFQPFKQLASLSYGYLFRQVEDSLDYALSCPSISVKFNLFMLVCELMDRNYLERNIVMVKSSEDEVLVLSRCVNKLLKFLETYLKTKHALQLNQQLLLLDISVLIFFDKILSQFLGYFENHEAVIEIKQKIFLNILSIQNKSAQNAAESQNFILFCVESVLGYLLTYNQVQGSGQITDFIFETINRILMKFKWGIRRQVFKNSHIYAKLEHFFTQVEKQTNIKPFLEGNAPNINLALFHQFQRLKWRKKLLKIIALLYFDDIVDDYRRNLQRVFSALKQQHILTILLDIQGIGEAIDTLSIYKTFLQMIDVHINVDGLTRELVQFASTFTGYDKISRKYPQVKIIKEVIKMHKAVLSNKGQRIGNPKNMQSVYGIIKTLIPYWISFLQISTGEQWLPVIRQVIELVSDLIKCDRINFYLVQRVCGDNYVDLMHQMFGKMIAMSDKIEENPKFFETFLSSMSQIARQIIEVLFFPSLTIRTPQINQKNKQISEMYLKLFLIVFERIPLYLEQIKVGNNKNEPRLDKCLEIVKFTLSFIDFKRRQCLSHRQEMKQINVFVDEMKHLIFQYQTQILTFLATDKHMSQHRRTLCTIMYEGGIIYPELMEVLIGGMNLPNYLLTEAKECLDCLKKQQQELFIDKMKTWLKMLHMSEEQAKKSKEENRDFFGFMGIL